MTDDESLPSVPEPIDRARRIDPAAALRRDAFSGVVVLVVEDDDLTRGALVLLLAHYGAQVFAAASVGEAMRYFDRVHPALVVSDIGLPDDDGYTLIGRIRARDGAHRHTAAIAVSGSAGGEIGGRARAAGFDEFILKPLNITALLGAVVRLLAYR